jgi:PrgI family protein
MGTYKVPQNVEAEDKILGPLSLKQFIYALIGLGWGFLTFAILKSVIFLWLIVGIPPTLFMLGLGLYQRDDQPLEVFVVAIAQFFARPRQRFWQKEPIAEVFRLQPPPPKAELVKRDPREVHSQLQQLAELVDTRGWSMKEPELQEPEETQIVDLKDRIGVEAFSQPPALAATPDVTDDDDILNTQTTAAQNLNVLIENTVKSVRAEALEKMRTPQPAAVPAAPTSSTPAAAGTPSPALSQPQAATAPAAVSTSGSTPVPSDDILKLAAEGGDLTVSQIAAQARKHTALLAEGQSVSLRNATTV